MDDNDTPTHLHLPTWAELDTPIPTSPPGPSGPWLPKTDWSRDGIIASPDH